MQAAQGLIKCYSVISLLPSSDLTQAQTLSDILPRVRSRCESAVKAQSDCDSWDANVIPTGRGASGATYSALYRLLPMKSRTVGPPAGKEMTCLMRNRSLLNCRDFSGGIPHHNRSPRAKSLLGNNLRVDSRKRIFLVSGLLLFLMRRVPT